MKVDPLGDSAFILRDLDRPAYEVAVALQSAAPIGLIEAIASFETVGVYVDPFTFDPQSLATIQSVPFESVVPRKHRIPVCYELGPDLEASAAHLGLTSDDVIQWHVSVDYTCYAIGFCPGFPYLGYLPDSIAGVPRRDNPRTRVEPGMVGITGRQTGIYPLPRPGGWALIGRTPMTIVDPEERYFPIQAGHTVSFFAVSQSEYSHLLGERL